MFRKFTYLLLIFSVFWQAGGLTVGALAAQNYADGNNHAGHAILHWQNSDHHHHDDGGLHADNSGGSIEHMQVESMGNTLGMPAADFPASHALALWAPTVHGAPAFLSPDPDGLLRPPKNSA